MNLTAATPKVRFPYFMRTIDMMEHSQGVAWTADLYRRVSEDGATYDKKVGSVEQYGEGGADQVWICWDKVERNWWHTLVNAAFDGNEENATHYLLLQEEANSVLGQEDQS